MFEKPKKFNGYFHLSVISALRPGFSILNMEFDPRGESLRRIRISGRKSPMPASRGQKIGKPLVENYCFNSFFL